MFEDLIYNIIENEWPHLKDLSYYTWPFMLVIHSTNIYWALLDAEDVAVINIQFLPSNL